MSDWQPQVVRIEKVEKHPDADALDIATVLGDYPVIVKRNEYQEGDLAGYIPIDSIVPDVDMFYFLCPKAYEKYEDEAGQIQQRQLGSKYPVGSVPEKYRIIKAKKLRGRYSQGMLVHMAPWITAVSHNGETISNMPEIGGSIVDLIGLKKWEEQEEDNIPNAKKSRGANAESPPKGWSIPYYDVDGLRKYVDCLLPDEEIVLTEKVHGSNAAFCHDGERLWVKSRNFYKKMDEDDPWWDIAIRYDLVNKLAKFPNMVFFGEMYGSVKGFRYDCVIESGAMHTKIRFFDIWDVKQMKYLDYDPFVAMVQESGLDLMPELYRGVWQGKDTMYPYAEGMTTLGGKHIREGFVLRTAKERYESRLDSRMQVKLVGEGYNLQK
jgi:RNA ligase (TIGR02306 family)